MSLPESDKYTYLVECYQALLQHKFCGTPVANCEVHVRVNLDDETQAKVWVDRLSEKTKCTYRVSCTYKPSLKCVSFQKPLTKRQQQLHDQKKEISYFVVWCKL